MSDSGHKVSGLPQASSIANIDKFYVVANGESKSASTALVASAISADFLLNIVAPYNSAQNYAVGDYCSYDSGVSGTYPKLYKCIDPTTGEWNSTKWQEIKVLTEVATKQDALTFDDVPTDDSNNPVKSNGIYDAIASEASARSSADTTLQSNIDNLSNETIHIDSDGKFFVYVDEE